MTRTTTLLAIVALAAVPASTLAGEAQAATGTAKAQAAKKKRCSKPKRKQSRRVKRCKRPKPRLVRVRRPNVAPPPQPAPPTPAPAPATQPAAPTTDEARGLLSGMRFTRFVETSSSSSLDQRLHLCSDGRFIYDSVSNLSGIEPLVERTTGTWNVASVEQRAGQTVVRLQGTTDAGERVGKELVTNGSRVTVDGNLWYAERSDLCS